MRLFLQLDASVSGFGEICLYRLRLVQKNLLICIVCTAASSKKAQASYPISLAAPDVQEVARFNFNTLSPDDEVLAAQRRATGSAESSGTRQQQQSQTASHVTRGHAASPLTRGKSFCSLCHAALRQTTLLDLINCRVHSLHAHADIQSQGCAWQTESMLASEQALQSSRDLSKTAEQASLLLNKCIAVPCAS